MAELSSMAMYPFNNTVVAFSPTGCNEHELEEIMSVGLSLYSHCTLRTEIKTFFHIIKLRQDFSTDL